MHRQILNAIWLSMLTTISMVAPAAGQSSREPLVIEAVFVGLPIAPSLKAASLNEHLFKEGRWTPVFVFVKCVREYQGPAVLIVDAPDSDEVPARYTVAMPQIAPNTVEMVMGYARPGARENSISVFIAKSKPQTPLEPTNIQLSNQWLNPVTGMDAAQFLFFSIGSKLEGVRLPGMPIVSDEERMVGTYRGQSSRSLLASTPDLRIMPNIWFGYQGVDLVLLNTSDREFMGSLINERDGKKAALVEWVKRGGRIVVSVGKNADLVASSGELKELLPVDLRGTADVEINRFVWSDLTAAETPLGKMSVARAISRPNRPMKVAVPGPKDNEDNDLPLVINSSFGMGRVTVVTFDLDEKSLIKWKDRDTFWRELVNRAGNRLGIDTISNTGVQMYGRGRYGEHSEDEELAGLVRTMEQFPGVPVISFGWVALFILIYIIIVGPLDYLFLKKVVKRLELTWITFPTIVLVVSATAYYAAYALKGSQLRINKFDVVDIDMQSKLMSGRSWFTLFSPRIQNYQVGVDPNPDWVGENTDHDVLVGWAGQSRYNTRQSLFRRRYDYRAKATGLINVPIQVWSTKGFDSQWFASVDPSKPPVEADLRRPPGERGKLIGSITVNLPEALDNAFLLDATSSREPVVRELGSLRPGDRKTIASQEPKQFSNWIASPGVGVWFPMGMTFHDLCGGKSGAGGNASLRDMDMSWRFSGASGDVAILVGTMPTQEGLGKDVGRKPGNPSRLWLGSFPGKGERWPELDGQLKQSTCVRIVIPIRSAEGVQP